MHVPNPPVKPVVVVADDDPDMRRFLHDLLRQRGYTVLTAMDVHEAMTHLHRQDVAAAVIDMLFVNSGGYSGVDLLRFMRRSPSLARVPVIVLTGFPLNRTVMRDIDALGGELWHKPVDGDALGHRLHVLLLDHPISARGRQTW
jgi:DNA-binding response OmpR family regulator